MAKKIDVPFNGTKEQEEKLRAELAQLKKRGDNGLMIAALQKSAGHLRVSARSRAADHSGRTGGIFGGSIRSCNVLCTIFALSEGTV